jgi:hypothetical protein
MLASNFFVQNKLLINLVLKIQIIYLFFKTYIRMKLCQYIYIHHNCIGKIPIVAN